MKKDFTNRKVVNSIGIGFLAMITSGTPVLAALNNAMNENEAADQTMETDLPTDAAAATQNAEIMDVLTGTQEVIQNVQVELNQQAEDFGSRSEENVQKAERRRISSPRQNLRTPSSLLQNQKDLRKKCRRRSLRTPSSLR
ncbi:MAG: hypothetical protein HFH16_03895 [Ruminococcus sp.]|nr:hypothetical protein [Ruminococcus sp.]